MEYQGIVDALAGVAGVCAVALGGSRAGGNVHSGSDHDLGVYYHANQLDVAALGDALTRLDDWRRPGLLNPPGAWGPWINGGGWLTVGGEPVDLLLREVGRVGWVIEDCVAGRIELFNQSGHPFGFVNAIYAGETHFAQPLWQDGRTQLDALKRALGGYPPKMRAALIRRFLWDGWFSLECTRKAALRGDVNYAMGGAFHTVTSWALVVHALNERHWMNEKGALERLADMSIQPRDMRVRIERVYNQLACFDAEAALCDLDALQAELRALTEPFEVPEDRIR